MSFFPALVEIDRHLSGLSVRWALMGGLAVSLRAEPRTTHDIDLAIAVDGDPEAENLFRDLEALGYRPYQRDFIHENEETGRISLIRLLAPFDQFESPVVDLLFDASGIEPEIVASSERLDVLPGIALPVITMGRLLAVKVLANRPKDLADIASLLRFAYDDDLREARSALDLISRRGFDEGRELELEFDRLLEEFERSQKRQKRRGFI